MRSVQVFIQVQGKHEPLKTIFYFAQGSGYWLLPCFVLQAHPGNPVLLKNDPRSLSCKALISLSNSQKKRNIKIRTEDIAQWAGTQYLHAGNLDSIPNTACFTSSTKR